MNSSPEFEVPSFNIIHSTGMRFVEATTPWFLRRWWRPLALSLGPEPTGWAKSPLIAHLAGEITARYQAFGRKYEPTPLVLQEMPQPELLLTNEVSLGEAAETDFGETPLQRIPTFQEMLARVGQASSDQPSVSESSAGESPAAPKRQATFQEMLTRIGRVPASAPTGSTPLEPANASPTAPAAPVSQTPGANPGAGKRIIRRAPSAQFQEFSAEKSRTAVPVEPALPLSVSQPQPIQFPGLETPPPASDFSEAEFQPDQSFEIKLPVAIEPSNIVPASPGPASQPAAKSLSQPTQKSALPTQQQNPTHSIEAVPSSQITLPAGEEIIPLPEADPTFAPVQTLALPTHVKPAEVTVAEPKTALAMVPKSLSALPPETNISVTAAPPLIGQMNPVITPAQAQSFLVSQGWRFKRRTNTPAAATPLAAQAVEALEQPATPGKRLAPTTQTIVEKALARDFGEVRLHTAPLAPLNLQAATRGRDIFVEPGRDRFDTPDSLALLGHELSHVTQQGWARPLTQTSRASSVQRQSDSERLDEIEAENNEQIIRSLVQQSDLSRASMPEPNWPLVSSSPVPRSTPTTLLKHEFPLISPTPLTPPGPIQRQSAPTESPNTDAPITERPQAESSSEVSEPDLKRLAQKIYPLIKRRLVIERQQMPH
ncbi:MAG: DUF4157 domain-containing protein [Anaerolineae bacterium]|nr:DUF4157 domain-containing protein [Anaerolineae bacterium]